MSDQPIQDDDAGRRARLRPPSSYASVGAWYDDYRGFVPIVMAHALSVHMRREGVTFPQAYAALVARRAIIEIEN